MIGGGKLRRSARKSRSAKERSDGSAGRDDRLQKEPSGCSKNQSGAGRSDVSIERSDREKAMGRGVLLSRRTLPRREPRPCCLHLRPLIGGSVALARLRFVASFGRSPARLDAVVRVVSHFERLLT